MRMKMNELFGLRDSIRSYTIDEKRRKTNEASGPARDPNATRVKIATPKVGTGAAGQFEESPVDLAEIGRAYHTDSYIRRAVDKIVGLMFKSGWNFVSLNEDALNYVETRFKLMEEATGQSTEELLREAGMNYVLYANAPFAKTRGSENLANLQATGYYGGEPISGIFNVSPEYFQVQRDEFGNIENYTVTGDGGGQGVEFNPEDFSHLTYHRPTGRAYGVPYINNVIDDILILRQIEENIARLVYRNIFPLQTYTVGRVEPGYEATDDEIDEVTAMIQNAPLDSIIVMPERHKIETVSSNNGALQAYDYLRYFRQRVFTGLGVSESTMGIGDSSNRSTSDNQSSDLLDLVKDFQQNFAAEFQSNIVNEILFEGGFDPTLNKEDQVTFTFTEIEQAAKIARENHEVQKFMMNIQSLDQTRNNMGYEPAEDLSRFYFNLITNASSGYDQSSAEGTVDNKDRPENQAGKQASPNSDSIKDAVIMKNIQEKQNTLLTNPYGKVTLRSDDANGLTEKDLLTANWLDIKQNLFLHQSEGIDSSLSIANIIENGLSQDLFSSKKERTEFSRLLSESVKIHLDKSSQEGFNKEQFSSLLYKYEEAVLKHYQNFLNHQQGGGK